MQSLLEEIVARTVAEMREMDAAREKVLGLSRRARMFSKQAIMLVHNGALSEARAKIDEAHRLLGEVENLRVGSRELAWGREVQAAGEEYAEASILHALKTTSEFPDPKEVGVPLPTYLLGLGDVVGELRRSALDRLLAGDLKGAEADLRCMDRIYTSLISAEEASLLLRGVRRKLDIARGVIESTRGALASEIGRRRLSDSLKEFSEKLKEGR